MADPRAIRAGIEQSASVSRDEREKQYITEKKDLEAAYRADLAVIEQTRVDDLSNAGLNPDGSTPPTFDQAQPVNISPPQVTGTPTTGSELTSTDGLWSRADEFAYQWLRDGAGIGGLGVVSTESTYELSAADEGHAIRCRVTALNESGSAEAFSNVVNATAP